MPRAIRVLMTVAATVLICGAFALVYLSNFNSKPKAVASPAVSPLTPRVEMAGMVIPAFTGISQDEQPVSQRVLDGQVTVLSFIFTHCPLACPAMTFAVQGLSDQLKDTSVRFLTISLDPAHDTPALLKKWGKSYDADFTRWTFVNAGPGTHEQILQGVLQEHLAADASMQIKLADGSTMDNIVHPVFVYLVGPNRQVLDRFSTKRPEDLERLVARATLAAASASAQASVRAGPQAR